MTARCDGPDDEEGLSWGDMVRQAEPAVDPVIAEMAGKLKEAFQPLIDFRDQNGVDVNDFAHDDDSDDILRRDVAEHIDRAFDELDSALRILENPEDYEQ